jgi:hypothetical protein
MTLHMASTVIKLEGGRKFVARVGAPESCIAHRLLSDDLMSWRATVANPNLKSGTGAHPS